MSSLVQCIAIVHVYSSSTYPSTYMCTYWSTRMHVYVRTRVRTYVRYTCTYTCTRTRVLQYSSVCAKVSNSRSPSRSSAAAKHQCGCGNFLQKSCRGRLQSAARCTAARPGRGTSCSGWLQVAGGGVVSSSRKQKTCRSSRNAGFAAWHVFEQ